MISSRGKKAIAVVLAVLVGLSVLLFSVVGIMLRSGAAGRILVPYIAGFVDADVSYDRLSATLLHIPKVTLSVENLSVTYPHDRFESFGDGDVPFSGGGRGDESDTLARVSSLKAGINILELMHGRIYVSHADVHGLRLYAEAFDDSTANWNVFRTSPKDEEEKTSTLPDIFIKHLRIGDDSTRVVFRSRPMSLGAALDIPRISVEKNGRLMDLVLQSSLSANLAGKDFDSPVNLQTSLSYRSDSRGTVFSVSDLKADILGIPVEADATVGMNGGAVEIDASANMPNFPAGELIEKYGTLFDEKARRISTDFTVSLGMSGKGKYDKETGEWPHLTADVVIPTSHFSYRGFVEDGKMDLSLSGEILENGTINLTLSDLCLTGSGADVHASGKVSDLLGEGLSVSADLDSKLNLASLMTLILPENDRFSAEGAFDFKLSANNVTRDQMTEAGIVNADFNAMLKGDMLDFNMPSQRLSAHLDSPSLELRTMKSLVQEGSNALAFRFVTDSAGVFAGSQYIKAKNLQLMAQDASSSISDAKVIPPLSALVKADLIAMRGSDSLLLAFAGTFANLIVKPVRSGDVTVPEISLQSSFERALYFSPKERMSLSGIEIGAEARKTVPGRFGGQRQSAQMGKPGRSARSQRWNHSRNAADSLGLPDYLREESFRAADINFSLGESLQKMFSTWQPSGRLKIRHGMLVTPAFPLRNRLSAIDVDFNVSHARVNNFTIVSGNSDLSVSATLKGIRKLTTGKGWGKYDLDVNLKSGYVDLNEIMSALQASSDKKMQEMDVSSFDSAQDRLETEAADVESYASSLEDNADSSGRSYPLIVIPGNLNASIDISAAKLRFAGSEFDSICAYAVMKERCLQISNLSAVSEMGSASLNAFYSTISKDDINLGFNVALKNITADKVIELVPKVGETVPVLSNFKGNLNFELASTCRIDTTMNLVLPSINGTAYIEGKDLYIDDYGPLKKLARTLMFKDRDRGHIEDMSIKALITDNQLEVFPFILGIDRYTLALTGSQTLQENYAYHVSVIKSPLPFKLGVKLYGDSFKEVKYRLEKPQYTSTILPLFDEQIDDMHVNLVTSIKNIFRKGVGAALEENRRSGKGLIRRKSEYAYREEGSVLDAGDMQRLDLELIKSEADEEAALLESEIDEIIAGL